MVNLGLGEHRVVFKFGSSDGGAVVRNQDQLGLALAECLDGRLVTWKQKTMSDQTPILAAIEGSPCRRGWEAAHSG